jgi:hypothetical protein
MLIDQYVITGIIYINIYVTQNKYICHTENMGNNTLKGDHIIMHADYLGHMEDSDL